MKLEHCKIFARLCEHITEVSSSMNLITGTPGGRQVIQTLHRDVKLAHDIQYNPVDKITWKDIKDMPRGAWVIVIGSSGTGAIRAGSSDYETYASDGGDVQHLSNSRSDSTMNFLKGIIGKPQKYYVGRNTAYVRDKQKSRASLKDVPAAGAVTQSTIVNKFRPLWARAITAAIADAKGHVSNMIKNDAFEKAKTKLSRIETLQNGLDSVEAGETPSFISGAVNTAVLMAASHHYPDQTGDITRSYGAGFSSQNSQGPRQILKDISSGDTAKLGTVLAFFKRALISG
jgi:hypothetical protein